MLQWYRDNVMIDGSYIINDNATATNDLVVYKLSRSDLNALFTCQAANNNFSAPLEASFSIDINCKKLSPINKSPLSKSISSNYHFSLSLSPTLTFSESIECSDHFSKACFVCREKSGNHLRVERIPTTSNHHLVQEQEATDALEV